jgi:toxin-antitoxin system PIN domain toxin
MNFLLDVNVLMAWGWADHAEHIRVAKWIGRTLKEGRDTLLTSAIPQLGFVRVSVQRTRGQITPSEAGEVLSGMIRALGERHVFLADDQAAMEWPPWCTRAEQTTDAHLLHLARTHDAQLATLDQGIPEGFLVP